MANASIVDYTIISKQIFKVLIWVVPIAFAIALLKSPLIKGYFGELIVRIVAWL